MTLDPVAVPSEGTATSASRWDLLLVGILLAVGVAGRALHLSGLPDTPDAVRLIHSLQRFDILEFSPQFPGYPLSVALARSLPIGGGLAWSWLAATAGVLAAILAAAMAGGSNRGAHLTALVLLLVHPFLFLESLRVGTDLLPLPFLYGGILLLRRDGGSWRGGVLIGLSLGFRPSLFPWLLALFAAKGRTGAWVGATLGIASWALPTAVVIGARSWTEEGLRFVRGHFGEWGGTVVGQSFAERAGNAFEHWLLDPVLPESLPGALRLVLGSALVVGLVVAVRRSGRSRELRPGPLTLGALGYAAWIAVAQPPEHPRHVLPLLLPCLAAASSGLVPTLTRRWTVWGLCLVLLALLLPTTARLAAAYRDSLPPAWEVAERLGDDPRFDPLVDRIYAGDDRAFFTSKEPQWSIGTAFSMDEIEADLLTLPLPPRRVWISTLAIADEGSAASPRDGAIWSERDPALCPWAPRVELFIRAEQER